MGKYETEQPLWKRNLAGTLDFLLAFFVSVPLAALLLNGTAIERLSDAAVLSVGVNDTTYSVSGVSTLIVLAMIAAYFVLFNRLGGTVFQRLFMMKRISRRGLA